MSDNNQGRIVFLDYMRVFAFISVLIGHKFQNELSSGLDSLDSNVISTSIAGVIHSLCYGGAAGVIVFFITSGYIITHVLQTESTTEFLIKRAFRIYPLYATALIAQYFIEDLPPEDVAHSFIEWIPRLLLLGDFFETPNALGGVDWTLRIEIIFYLFMAAMKSAGFISRSTWIPLILAACTAALYAAPQFPAEHIWIHGYFNLYAPFLFIGTCTYLIQTGKSNLYFCAPLIISIAWLFIKTLPQYHPSWSGTDPATPALILFFGAWALRDKLPDGALLRFVASLTYSVYLFHNWAWDSIMAITETSGVDFIPAKAQTLIVLFATCYLAHISIEKPTIRAGRYVISKTLKPNVKPATA